jgi:hypothetical protein
MFVNDIYIDTTKNFIDYLGNILFANNPRPFENSDTWNPLKPTIGGTTSSPSPRDDPNYKGKAQEVLTKSIFDNKPMVDYTKQNLQKGYWSTVFDGNPQYKNYAISSYTKCLKEIATDKDNGSYQYIRKLYDIKDDKNDKNNK